MLVSITGSNVVQVYHGTAVPVKASLLAVDDFDSDGVRVAKGSLADRSFRQDFTASISGNGLNIATGSAYSTTGAPTPGKYTLVFFDASDNPIYALQNIQIPAASPTTWGSILAYSDGVGQASQPPADWESTLNTLLAAYDATVVHNSGNESVGGIKAFSSSPTVPTPTTSLQVVNKSYADGLVVGLLDDRGNYDASGNVFPSSGGSGAAGAILKGDLWLISVPGTLGGTAVIIGSTVRALVDTPGQTAANWDVLAVGVGYTPENIANKSTNIAGDAASNTKYPGVKAIKDYVDSVAVGGSVFALNITSNGAVGDGSHDDAPAIQATRDTIALLGGGIVKFPKPTAHWRCNGPIIDAKGTGVSFVGMGGRAVSSITPTCPLVYYGSGTCFIRSKQSNGTIITGLDIRYIHGFTGDLINLCAENTALAFTSANVSAGADTITISSHAISTGQALILATTGTLPTGITAGTYYAIVVDANTIKLATTLNNALAGTAVDITGVGVGSSTATISDDGNVSLFGNIYGNSFGRWGSGGASKAFTSANVSAGSDTITITAHGLPTGRPVTFVTVGTLPVGLVINRTYFVIAVDANTIKLATSPDNATAGTAIDITGVGAGSSTLQQDPGTARSCINLSGSVCTGLSANSYEYANYGVIGFTGDSRDKFATAITFEGPLNFFRNCNVAGMANHDEQWNVRDAVFEYLYPITPGLGSGRAGAYINQVENTARSSGGLTFDGCGFWDVAAEGGVWITYSGNGLTIANCKTVQLGSSATFLKLVNGGETFTLENNKATGTGTATWLDAQDTTYQNVIDDDSNEIQNTITRNAAGNKVVRGRVAEYTVVSDIASHGNVGGSAQALSTLVIPGATFYRNGEVMAFKAFGDFAANGNNKKVTLDDGAAEFDSGTLTDNNTGWVFEGEITYIGATAGEAWYRFSHGASQVTTRKSYAGITWASAIPWAIKVTGTADNDIVLKSFVIRKRNPPL